MSRFPSAGLRPPVDPMRAAPITELPEPGGQRGHPSVIFEPKWDGWRCLAFVRPNGV